MRIVRPSHCEGCYKWREECKEICEKHSPDDLIYGVECSFCGDRRKTCWMAILPDGWTIPVLRGEGLLCPFCTKRFGSIYNDLRGYRTLEDIEW